MQRANLVLSGVMVLAAAYGVLRAVRSGRGLAIGILTGAYGVCLLLNATFVPDPVTGFPSGQAGGVATTGGILHLVFGAIGFVCLAAAAFAYARWASSRGEIGRSRFGLWSAVVILVGFLAGAVLAQSAIGIVLLWLSDLAGWLWLALASAHLYTATPHPVLAQRSPTQEHL